MESNMFENDHLLHPVILSVTRVTEETGRLRVEEPGELPDTKFLPLFLVESATVGGLLDHYRTGAAPALRYQVRSDGSPEGIELGIRLDAVLPPGSPFGPLAEGSTAEAALTQLYDRIGCTTGSWTRISAG
jgi:hypothetical protein